jgi:DNA-binding transcriptional ArsR family regulator
MANERRLLILCYLMEGEKSVGQLVSLIGISQSALSQHLARLRRGNLVTTRRENQNIYYSLSSQAVPIVLDAVQRVFVR